MYALTDKEGSDVIFFVYHGELDETVGTGSEVIVTGTVGEKIDTELTVLIADNVEVKNKKGRVYAIGDIENLYENEVNLHNKMISVTGEFNEAFGGYVLDGEGDSVILNNVTPSDINKIEDFLFTNVTGRLTYKDGFLAIDVDSIE